MKKLLRILHIISTFVFVLSTNALTSTGGAVEKKPNNLQTESSKGSNECSFSNLKQVIKHSDFAVVGKKSNCDFFFFTQSGLNNPKFNLDKQETIPVNKCNKAMKPMFYLKADSAAYRLFCGFRFSIYLFPCIWKPSNTGYYSCTFSKTLAEERLLDSLPNVSDPREITTIGYINNPHTVYVHLIYKSVDEQIFDGTYNLRKSSFTKTEPLHRDMETPIAYDFDLRRLYFRNGITYHYIDVSENNGILTYSQKTNDLKNFPEKKYSAISFSGDYYLAKEKNGSNYRYYAGKIGEGGQRCIASSADSGLILELLVDVKNFMTFSEIIHSIEPRKIMTEALATTTVSNVSLTTALKDSFKNVEVNPLNGRLQENDSNFDSTLQ